MHRMSPSDREKCRRNHPAYQGYVQRTFSNIAADFYGADPDPERTIWTPRHEPHVPHAR